MWSNVVQEYGEVHNVSLASMPCYHSFSWKVDRLPKRSIEGRAAAFVTLKLADKLLAFQGTVVAQLHDAHSLQTTSILVPDKVGSCLIPWTGTVS